jgi:hypothetical protein
VLAFTPPERLTDQCNRPYFLWVCDLTLELEALQSFRRWLIERLTASPAPE